MTDRLPELVPWLDPPVIAGTAELSHRAFAGARTQALLRLIDRPSTTPHATAALLLDRSIVQQLAFARTDAMHLQQQALHLCQLYRVAATPGPEPRLRLLALMEPGDLMVNAPLDFLTRWLDIRLDLLYLLPGRSLPGTIPDHDVAYIGGGSLADPATLARRASLFRTWPRPVLNDPARVAALERSSLAARLADAPGIVAPPCRILSRDRLLDGLPIEAPTLIRPVGSHAGQALARLPDAAALAAYLHRVHAPLYYLTRYVDYRGADRLFRKYRIAFIGGAPFLCHLGISADWMIHYLNAGMAESAAKRAEEAAAMAAFEPRFVPRHARAFAALNDRIGLDYFSIDCAEAADGRLLVFEADAEAIVHLMDPPDLFPYKAPQMRRVFAAFAAMLRHRAARHPAAPAAAA